MAMRNLLEVAVLVPKRANTTSSTEKYTKFFRLPQFRSNSLANATATGEAFALSPRHAAVSAAKALRLSLLQKRLFDLLRKVFVQRCVQ